MGNKIFFIEVLRCISLLGVILFHTMGFLDSNVIENSIALSLIQKFSVYLVGISVSMFMFVSGYLYKPVVKHTKVSFIAKKAKRLLLPYFVFSTLIMLSGGFFNIGAMFDGFWHLWFLWALFYCFLLSAIVDFSQWYAYIVLLIAILVGGISVDIPAGIRDFLQWYHLFILGVILKLHPKIIEVIKRYHLWLPMASFYTIIICTVDYHYREPSFIYELANSALVIVLFILVEFLVKSISTSSMIAKPFLSIGQNSMGIYIFHYWVLIYLLSTTSIRIFHIDDFIQRSPALTISVLVMVNFLCCYILTVVLSKSKIGKMLLGN